MAHVTVKIKRPKFMEYFGVTTEETTRRCSHEGCDNAGNYVGGHYTVEGRQVRVWVCELHRVGNPHSNELPVPSSVLAGIVAEREYEAKMEKYYREHGNLDADHGVSIKVLVSTGHGKAYHPDRVASWRWEKMPNAKL